MRDRNDEDPAVGNYTVATYTVEGTMERRCRVNGYPRRDGAARLTELALATVRSGVVTCIWCSGCGIDCSACEGSGNMIKPPGNEEPRDV